MISKKELIEQKMKAKLEELSSIEIDELFLQRQVVGGNKKSEMPLAVNQGQQRALKQYIEFLAEKYKEY